MASFKRGKITEYRGIRYRSKWEVYVAKLLLYSDTRFKYEPKRFFLSPKLSYLPDFYLPERGVFLEVKGVLTKKDKILLELFSRQHKIKYIGKRELEYIYGDNPSRISRIEDIADYKPNSSELYRFRRFLER